MRKILISISLLLITIFYSCKKEGYTGNSNNRPDIPVTVSGIYGMYTYPTVSTSLSGSGAISITLEIPKNCGRTIKEITRVAAGSSGTNYKSVEVTTGLYNTAPIAGNGNSVVFTTSLAEYTRKTGVAVTVGGTATSFLSKYFFFLITLDNGQTIIAPAVRVYVAG
jgi:hypothetical protein